MYQLTVRSDKRLFCQAVESFHWQNVVESYGRQYLMQMMMTILVNDE